MALVVAAAVAWAAYAAGSLSRSGAVAAFAIGGSALLCAWGWGAFLIVWFALASLLSRAGRARKLERTNSIVVKGDRRDATQVLANGGVFAALASASALAGTGDAALGAGLPIGSAALLQSLGAGAAAALVAAGADTWGTEIGTLRGGLPWSLRTLARVPVGTSGAVSLAGTFASATGAGVLAMLAGAFGVIPFGAVPLVAACGLAGATADTVVGAWWQERRWCAGCAMETEQAVHRCGLATERRAGSRLLTNDAVNLLCTVVGAGLALLVSRQA